MYINKLGSRSYSYIHLKSSHICVIHLVLERCYFEAVLRKKRLHPLGVNAFICSMFPTLLLLWCTHRMCMVDGSTQGLFSSSSIVGSSYVIVSIDMYAITCVSGKGPMYGV